MDLSGVTAEQFGLVYNAFSFTIALMGAATAFFRLQRSEAHALDGLYARRQVAA